MRFSTVALAVFGVAASASASLIARQSPYPDCATPCITGADYGSCQSTDVKCLCTNNAFVSSTTTCIQSKCTGDDLTKAQTVAAGLCSAVGVTLTPATGTPSTTGSTSGSATGTPSTTGSKTSGTATSPSTVSKTGTATGATTTPTSAASTNGVNAIIAVGAAAMAAFAL